MKLQFKHQKFQADAAKAVGITENHAGVKLSRMRAKLKKILEEEGITV